MFGLVIKKGSRVRDKSSYWDNVVTYKKNRHPRWKAMVLPADLLPRSFPLSFSLLYDCLLSRRCMPRAANLK